MLKRYFLEAGLILVIGVSAQAQTQTLPLTDLSAFRPQAGNWQIVGDVVINPDLDIHEAGKDVQPVKQGKKSKGAVSVTN